MRWPLLSCGIAGSRVRVCGLRSRAAHPGVTVEADDPGLLRALMVAMTVTLFLLPSLGIVVVSDSLVLHPSFPMASRPMVSGERIARSLRFFTGA